VTQIRFKVPVDVSGCRVIPASITPHGALLPTFTGQTKPATFTVEVFAKSLRFPSDRFQRLARPFTFSGDVAAQLDVEVRSQTGPHPHPLPCSVLERISTHHAHQNSPTAASAVLVG
jgi:hypothetical protein